MKFNVETDSPPAVPVVTATEAKEYLRIDNDLEDGRLDLMIAAATNRLQAETSLRFIDQTVSVYFDHFPYGSGGGEWWDGVRDTSVSEVLGYAKNICLPIGKASQLIGFETYGSDNVPFVSSPSNFIVDTVGYRARIGLPIGAVWPQTVLRSSNGIRVILKVGFGPTSDKVPAELKMAILEFVAHMYENRGDQNEMVIPPHILTLIAPFRRYKVEG